MDKIVHKFEVGDEVLFKSKFDRPTCGLVGKEGTWATISGIAFSYNNKPHYHLEGEEGVFSETLFVWRYEP